MPTEFIPPSVPEARDALRSRIEYVRDRLGKGLSGSQAITWSAFLRAATHGEMIGVADWEELEALLPVCDFDAVRIGNHPNSPENQALIDASEESDPIWSTPAQQDHFDITNGLHFYGGHMPEREAVAWFGYLQGSLEAGSISQSEHADLVRLLPEVQNNPVYLIVESANAVKAPAKA